MRCFYCEKTATQFCVICSRSLCSRHCYIGQCCRVIDQMMRPANQRDPTKRRYITIQVHRSVVSSK